MTIEQAEKLLMADDAGNYYLFSREMLEQARVPAEHTAGIRAALDEAVSESDVTGYIAYISTNKYPEESGARSPGSTLTTLAIGEESGGRPPILTVPGLPPFFR